TQLLALLVKHSYRYDPTGSFLLASGKRSSYYVDCRATTMRSEAFDLVGAVVGAQLPRDVEALGGLTLGADPIAPATASYCTGHGRPLAYFIVRKEAKGHGLGKRIEGPVRAGTKVAVIDDVVTTGSSTVEAIMRCKEAGLILAAVVVLVDRQEEEGLSR